MGLRPFPSKPMTEPQKQEREKSGTDYTAEKIRVLEGLEGVRMTQLHAGGKVDNQTYKFSAGLHGVGVSVVNALSERVELEIRRDGKVYRQAYERGKVATQLEEVGTTDKTGTTITFRPDTTIFETLDFSYDSLSQRFRELAFLNPGITISFVEYLNKNRTALHPNAIHVQGTADGMECEIAMQWNDGYQEALFSFVNTVNTHEGGTHLSGLRAALTRTINQYGVANNLTKVLEGGIEGGGIREGLTAVISIKVPSPQFEGQTKTKLGNPEVKGFVETVVNEKIGRFLEENPGDARRILNKVVDAAKAREAARKGRDLVRRKGAPA